MNSTDFWQLIERTWESVPIWNTKRKEALATNDKALVEVLENAFDRTFFTHFEQQLTNLEQEELTSFIHLLEQHIYQIDREEIHQYTDGSDDGFLYCRCFIVGMGATYYHKIDKNPEEASMDLEAESFGFTPYRVYQDKYGEEFDRYQFHSMETCSNAAGW